MRWLPLLAMVACGGKGDDTGTPQMVEVTGTFRVLDFHDPIEDVVVCADDPDDCLITDETGAFSWSFPANSEVWLTASHSGMADALVPFRTGSTDSDPVDVVLWPIDKWNLTLQSGGATWTEGAGGLLLSLKQSATVPALGTADPGVADAEIDIATEGVRTRYFENGGVFLDTLLSQTSNSGRVVAVGVSPGDHKLTVRPDSGTCAPRELGWSTKQPFQADRVTMAVFSCTPE